MARKGKIDSLPHSIREEVCRRLHDGQTGSVILPWLNSEEKVLAVLDKHFGEQPVSEQNLSEFRNSENGFKGWLKKREKTERIKSLSQYAVKLAAAGGGDLMKSSAAIAGGQILEILEGLDVTTQRELLLADPGNYFELLDKLARLQKSGADSRRAAQAEKAAALAEEKLALEIAKFRQKSAELIIEHAENERVKEIALSDQPKQIKMDALIKEIWGEAPE